MTYNARGDHGQERGFDGGHGGGNNDAGYVRARGKRPVTDYGSTLVNWMRHRGAKYANSYQGELERPSPSYVIDMIPPMARKTSPADSVPTRHLHSSLNKIKHPVNVVKWTPEGRRLLTASSSGEFTLWNGTGFNFETIMQAHDSAIRALAYSHSNDWLVSADQDGWIKYWQPNFNNIQSFRGHSDPIRDLAFAPTDAKFVSASDDSKLNIYDFANARAESQLSGHGWDAKSCDWHPTKGLIVSGSKDHVVKLWDPRNGRCLTTLRGHKNAITKTLFERVRGDCLATSGRDQVARIFDLRMMRDICLLRGHEKDISTLAWHPIHSNMISTGGSEGSLFHYLLDEANTPVGQTPSIAVHDSPDPKTAPAQTIYPAHKIPHAHDFGIWSLDWHPLGHILVSGANDRITRFWSRTRPGDPDVSLDRYHIGEDAAEARGTWDRRANRRHREEAEELELEDEMEGLVDQKMPLKQQPSLPGLPGLSLPQAGRPVGVVPPPPLPIIPGASGAIPPLPLPFPLPGLNGAPPPPIAGLDVSDPAKMIEFIQKAGIQLPPPGSIPPPGMLPPGFIPPPPGFPLPGGIPPPPPGFDAELQQNGDPSVRRRGPLPSQEESLREEQRRGNYTRVR